MISISSKDFEGQLHKIAAALVNLSTGKGMYNSRANHDLQPMGAARKSLNKPQDKPFADRMTRTNRSMSHLEDKRMTRSHLRK